jgi:hypothetical protein
MVRTAFILSIAFILPGILWAQSERTPSPADEILRLREETAQLHRQLDSLRASLDSAGSDDEVNQLEESFDKRFRELENKIDAVSRATAGTVLNPRTTAFINFAARADSKPVGDPADSSKEIGDRSYLRTVELELQNAVDPYADAVAIISLENQAGQEFGVDAEEAYGLLKRLPLIESAPLGLKLKIGKFRAPFGVNNKIHMHDLPWTTRPLAISKYLGTEHGNFFESGFNPTGLDANFYLPSPIPGAILEANLDAVRAGDIGLSGTSSTGQPAGIAHLTFSHDWSNEHILFVGASTYQEHGPAPTQMYGLDVTYKWAPSEERESKSFVAGGEFLTGKHFPVDSAAVTPSGWFGYMQYQTSYWLYLGARYDCIEEPEDASLVTKAFAGYLSYYTTEFLRFRLGLERRWSDLPAENNLTTGIFEVNFVFGSHPTEPYWVNR